MAGFDFQRKLPYQDRTDFHMDIIRIFGKIIGNQSLKNPERARKFLLAGYRLQEMKLQLAPDRELPPSGQYTARITMQTVIRALTKPEHSAMISIFVPGELLAAAGLTPYSVETMSCFLGGTKCEQTFLARAGEEGFPETMCSYHRIFLGAALTGLVPKPKCMLYTNLACDGNMMTFPWLKEKLGIPAFFIDVPYEKSKESVSYVAEQLREAKCFLEEQTGKPIPEERLRQAEANSRRAASNYQKQLALRNRKNPVTTLTNELYGLFMSYLLAGTEESVTYTKLLLTDTEHAGPSKAPGIVWMHIMPFLEPSVKEIFNYQGKAQIRACDFVADGFRPLQAEDPYEAMAEKMVYSVYNGDLEGRIRTAENLVRQTGADGVILFAHWGCKSTCGASTVIKEALESDGIPVLVLDGDGCNPANMSGGQTATRLQAFLEMLGENQQAEP